MSKVDEYKKQLAIIETLKQNAISELEGLLKEARAEVSRLEANLAEMKSVGAKPSKAGKKRQLDPTKPCPICNFATSPNHDKRKHRSQDPKKAFTAKELGELGLTKG